MESSIHNAIIGRLTKTYISAVQTQYVNQKTCQEQWMIGFYGERNSKSTVLSARLNDDDNFSRKKNER